MAITPKKSGLAALGGSQFSFVNSPSALSNLKKSSLKRLLTQGNIEVLAVTLREIAEHETQVEYGKFLSLLADMILEQETEYGMVFKFLKHPKVKLKSYTLTHALKMYETRKTTGLALEAAGYEEPNAQKLLIVEDIARKLNISESTVTKHWRIYKKTIRPNEHAAMIEFYKSQFYHIAKALFAKRKRLINELRTRRSNGGLKHPQSLGLLGALGLNDDSIETQKIKNENYRASEAHRELCWEIRYSHKMGMSWRKLSQVITVNDYQVAKKIFDNTVDRSLDDPEIFNPLQEL